MQHTPINGIHDVIRLTDVIPESDDPVLRHARSVINKSLYGSVILEFDARRVVVSNFRGDKAMRLHAIVQDHREGDPSSARWADQLDPRYSTADARLVTFDVSRILSVLWEPERLVHGDEARRQLVAACIRIVRTSAKHKDPRDWDTQDYADYGAVVLDMDDVDPGDDPSTEAECDEDNSDSEVGDDDDDDPNDSGDAAKPAPDADDSDAEDDPPASDEAAKGGDADV